MSNATPTQDEGFIADAGGRQKLVQELAAAVSTQAQVVNRLWLALMTVALFGVLPRLPAKDGNVSLPFSLGEVDPKWFHSVVFSILVVLTIAFAGRARPTGQGAKARTISGRLDGEPQGRP